MTLELEEGFRRRVAGSKAVITLCQSARVFHDSKRTGLKEVPHLRSRTVGKGMSKGGVVVGFVGLGTMGSRMAANVGANERGGEPVNYSRGLIESPPTYYEALEPAGGAKKPPMVLISGGAHTGACYLATADGRPGWAHAFVRAGYKVVVPDWPGVGRSGYIPFADLTGEVVVEGLGKVVASLGQPAIIMTHSMSGIYGWKLIENYGQHITKVVAVALGPPGNIQAVSDIISETEDTVVVRGSVTLTINLKQPVV